MGTVAPDDGEVVDEVSPDGEVLEVAFPEGDVLDEGSPDDEEVLGAGARISRYFIVSFNSRPSMPLVS